MLYKQENCSQHLTLPAIPSRITTDILFSLMFLSTMSKLYAVAPSAKLQPPQPCFVASHITIARLNSYCFWMCIEKRNVLQLLQHGWDSCSLSLLPWYLKKHYKFAKFIFFSISTDLLSHPFISYCMTQIKENKNIKTSETREKQHVRIWSELHCKRKKKQLCWAV